MSNNNIGWTKVEELAIFVTSVLWLPRLPSHWAGTAGTVAVRLGRQAVTKWDSLLATWRFCHRNNAVKVLISMKVLISKLAVTSNVRVSLFFCQEISVHWNHISYSLRSKRFRFSVSEQRKIEERDSRFWPREKWNENQKHGNACYAGYISYGGPQGLYPATTRRRALGGRSWLEQ